MFVSRSAFFRRVCAGLALKVLAVAMALVLLDTPEAEAGRCPAGQVSLGNKCGTPVTTHIELFDSAGQLTTISDDGGGAYIHGVGGVESYLLEDGYFGFKHDWRFDVRESTRLVTETFNASDEIDDPADPHYQGVPAAAPYQGSIGWPAQLNLQCTWSSHDLLNMEAGDSFTCGLINEFFYSTTTSYNLNAAFSRSGIPGTTDALVTCNLDDIASGGRGCKDWTVEPVNDPTIGLQAVGRLHEVVVVRNKQTKTNRGGFYMRFRIHLTRP